MEYSRGAWGGGGFLHLLEQQKTSNIPWKHFYAHGRFLPRRSLNPLLLRNHPAPPPPEFRVPSEFIEEFKTHLLRNDSKGSIPAVKRRERIQPEKLIGPFRKETMV